MKTKNLIALALTAACAFAAAGEPFRAFNVVPLPQAGQERQVAADCVEYVRRTGNRVCLCCMTLHPEGKPALEKPRQSFEKYRRLRDLLKGTDVELGILIQSIVGHWRRVDRDIESWARTVNIDGDSVRFCPLDPDYADYIRTIGRMCAAERPAFILGDDDIRAASPQPECFCERHRKLFCERMGRDCSPEEFRAVPSVGYGRSQLGFNACPAKPGALAAMLEMRRKNVARLNGSRVGGLIYWPYDEGGCGCTNCHPWGANGYVRLIERLHLSARAYDKVLRVARTIADLAGSEPVRGEDVFAAIRCRRLDDEESSFWI